MITDISRAMACLQSSDVLSLKLSNEQLLRKNEDSVLLDGKFNGKRKQCRSYINEKDLPQSVDLEMVGCSILIIIVIEIFNILFIIFKKYTKL